MKKITSLVLALLLLAITALPALANPSWSGHTLAHNLTFEGAHDQIPVSDWAIDHILKGHGAGIIPASMYKDFKAGATREEFCKMSLYYLCYATRKTVDELLEELDLERDFDRFTDTDDPDLLAAAALGITAGTSQTEFGPQVAFNRAQAAIFLRNTCRLLEEYETEDAPAAPFKDMGSVPGYAADAVNFVFENGIMAGDGISFNPEASFERQAAVTTYSNMMGARDLEIFVRASDGVTFDPATDIVNGWVKPEVIDALMAPLFNDTRFYFDAAGQFWMDITFPELPKGWEWRFNVRINWGMEDWGPGKPPYTHGVYYTYWDGANDEVTIFPDNPEWRFTAPQIIIDPKGSIHIPADGVEKRGLSVNIRIFPFPNADSYSCRGALEWTSGALLPAPDPRLQKIFDWE